MGRGLDVTVVAPDEVGRLQDYDDVVLGSAVYSGHWLRAATELVQRSADLIARRPMWLFSSGPAGDPARRLVQQMAADHAELADILARTEAREHQMFAGKLEMTHLSVVQKAALTLFRGLEGDFRDWTAVQAWADSIADELKRRGGDSDGG